MGDVFVGLDTIGWCGDCNFCGIGIEVLEQGSDCPRMPGSSKGLSNSGFGIGSRAFALSVCMRRYDLGRRTNTFWWCVVGLNCRHEYPEEA